MANSTRCIGLQLPAFAPTSRSTVASFVLGIIEASAGRDTPLSLPSIERETARAAAVFPVEIH
jgi:hypothetical protein